jgi:hypothetical protein
MQIRIACFPRLNIKKKTVLNLEFKLSFQSFQLKLFYHLAQIPLFLLDFIGTFVLCKKNDTNILV